MSMVASPPTQVANNATIADWSVLAIVRADAVAFTASFGAGLVAFDAASDFPIRRYLAEVEAALIFRVESDVTNWELSTELTKQRDVKEFLSGYGHGRRSVFSVTSGK